MAELAGVNEDQIRRQGRWHKTSMNGAYLRTLPREMMRTMAGFPNQPGQFYSSHAAVDPPVEVSRKNFPPVDFWNDRMMAKQADEGNDDPVKVTVATQAFLSMMLQLRKSFIQDSVSMMERMPDHPIWNNTFFSDPLYLEFGRQSIIISSILFNIMVLFILGTLMVTLVVA